MGGFNLGSFMGGAADGYRKQNEDLRRQSEEKRVQDEADRIETDRKADEDVNKQTAEYMKQKLTTKTEQPQSSAQPAAPVITNPVAGGIAGNAQASADPAADPGVPSPIASQGIGAPTQPEKSTPSAPKFRQPDVNDMVDVAQHRTSLYLNSGKYDKAVNAHKDYIAFAAEKLQSEATQRANIAKRTVSGIMMGDYSGLSAVYDTIPDGNKLKDVVPNSDGTIAVTVVGKDGQPKPTVTFKNPEHLANAVMSMVDTGTVLKYMDKQGTDDIKRAELAQKITNENTDAAEKKRHNIAEEGINRTKAQNPGDGGSTAEMKNAKAFFPDLPPAEGLKKFHELLQKEGGLTQSSDGFGGINVIDHRTNEIYNLRNGKKTVMQAGEAPASGAKPGGAPTQAVPPPEKREIGKAYPTPKGMMIWRGNGWSAN